MPGMEIDDLIDAGLEHLFQASETGLNCGVDSGSLDGDAKPGGGEDRILLRVDTDTEVVARA